MLTRLQLDRFKSFHDEAIVFSGLTILVGANAAGRSNLLDAVRFLQGVALDMNIVDVLRGRWEGGRQTWPGVRGGVQDVALRGSDEFVIESTWRLGGETITHRIGVEVGTHPMLTQEKLTSDRVTGYLFDTHARALGGQTGRDEGSSIRVALKRTGKGNSPAQTHSASRSLLHQIDTTPPVSPELARVRSAVAGPCVGPTSWTSPRRVCATTYQETSTFWASKGRTSRRWPGLCARTNTRGGTWWTG